MLLVDSLFNVMKIREIVQQALRISYLTVEAENQLRLLLQSKYDLEDFNAFIELQIAVMNDRVRQEARELSLSTADNRSDRQDPAIA